MPSTPAVAGYILKIIMKQLSLIDTHCDTAFELYHRKQSIVENTCHVSLEKASQYKNYTQFFAIWADRRRCDDECYNDFLKISDNLFSEIENNSDKIAQVRTFSEMEAAWAQNKRAAFLAVEDARILGGQIDRLDELKRRGVSYLTLQWGGQTCIGASHDAEGGLTDFGREVVRRCFELGIVPDISHANEQVTDEVMELCYTYKKPFIATHSDCYDLFPHTRNLRKKHLDGIKDLGGIVGLNLCPYHIKDMSDKRCTLDDVMRHLEKYLELGGENVLGMGCDLDGTGLPEGFGGVNDLSRIAEEMEKRGYSEELIEKLFFTNEYEFIKRNF